VQEPERNRGIASERAVVVRVVLGESPLDDDPFDEIRGLAKTAGASVVGSLSQNRARPDVATYLGSGKVEELKQLAKSQHADVVLFDCNLSPGQGRNLEKQLGLKVLDRTELILDIFASNAQTYEARLAVELAQMEYSLPRLKQMWSHLSRIKMGIGMRGPGEKQLETDRRLVERRIHELRSELRQVELRRERQVASRREQMTVSLVGYTNAGKSTLMNGLTGAGVLAEDKLFATLDTRTRRWQLPNWGPVLLSDTVGFIRDLPHGLIASFKATLEESRQADLLLHVADASNPSVARQIESVFSVLGELGIEAKQALLVLNKIDHPRAAPFVEGMLRRYPNAIPISARSGEGFERLAHAASDALSRTFVDVEVETSVANGKLIAFLQGHSEVLSMRYVDDRVVVHCRIPERFLGRFSGDDTVLRRKSSRRDTSPGTDAPRVSDTGSGSSPLAEILPPPSALPRGA
jgi:GTP-binding protein HflX